MPTDEELVRRLTAGDEWAKEAIYRKHVSAVFRAALRLLGHRPDAEDVTHDVFVTMYVDIERLHNPSLLLPWLLRITVHHAHRRFRRRKLLRLLGLDRSIDDAPLESLAFPGADPEAIDALALIERELGAMPLRHRTAWTLRRVEGYAVEEVAVACACSVATAKRWIAAAHAKISRRVELEVTDVA
jgi:RNA polymerase sigma-70 factor (ECF subfamily)